MAGRPGGPGSGTVWLVAGLSVVHAVVTAFDMPAQQTLVVEMLVRREDPPNAIALNSPLVNGSRLVGPALAGAVIAPGSGASAPTDGHITAGRFRSSQGIQDTL